MMQQIQNVLFSNWETVDLLKIIGSIISGIVLGAEREFKDKSAGLKTITTICMGSTLFTILSFKMGSGESEDATRIASYVVSGIGFLGAGVIFKDGWNVSGLTTASIIWMAAAIGMSFGFGEYMLALCFLLGSIFIIHGGNFVNKVFFDNRVNRILTVHIDQSDYKKFERMKAEIAGLSKSMKEKKFRYDAEKISITYDVFLYKERMPEIKKLLMTNPIIKEFDI